MAKKSITKEIAKRISEIKPSTRKFIGVCAQSATFGLIKGMTMGVVAGVTYNYMKDNDRSEFASVATASAVALGSAMVMDHVFDDIIGDQLEECAEMRVAEMTQETQSKFADGEGITKPAVDFGSVVKKDLDEISKMTGGTMSRDDLTAEAKKVMDKIQEEKAAFDEQHQEINRELDQMSDDLDKLMQE